MRIPHLATTLAVLGACAACAGPAGAQTPAPAPGGVGYDESDSGLVVHSTPLLHRAVRVSGTLAGARKGDRVVVQRLSRSGGWQNVGRARADADGAFSARWTPVRTGPQTLRALEVSATRSASAAAAQAVTKVTVYRPGIATWFGPGFYGEQTACGQTLAHATLGVAHRTLPCGTLVELAYKGRTVTVPVIDRGPFRAGTTWDLTEATAAAIGMSETSRIGALVVSVPAR